MRDATRPPNCAILAARSFHQTFRSQKFGQEFRTMSDDVCSWRRAAFANAARIDFAGSRCPRFRHTLKRFGSFARHDLAKLIFVSDKV